MPTANVFPVYDDGHARRAPVGSFPAGVSPTGALDMTGNVAEWCQDVFVEDAYLKSVRQDPVVSEGTTRHVARGSSYCRSPAAAPAVVRSYHATVLRIEDLGFRVAVSLR